MKEFGIFDRNWPETTRFLENCEKFLIQKNALLRNGWLCCRTMGIWDKIVVKRDNKLEIHFHGDAPPEFRAKKIPQSGGNKKLFFDENGGSGST